MPCPALPLVSTTVSTRVSPWAARALGWPLLLAAAGCVVVEEKPSGGPPTPHGPHVGGSAGAGGEPSPGDDSGAPAGWSVAVTWGEDALTVEVADAPGGLWLGLVETGGACAEAGGCWDGEDCRDGFTTASGEVLGPWCHALDADGRAELLYGGDITALEPGTTAFRAGWAGRTTFLLESRPADGGDGSCVTWGDDPSRYLAEGCALLP
jgi:hypothetical protein